MLRFAHVNLGVPTDGIADESTFLVDVLGMARVEPPPELRDRAFWFEFADGAQVHLSEDPDHRPAARAHVAIDVGDELDTIGRRFAEHGLEPPSKRTRPDVVVLDCTDPAGNRWELRGI
jgi:catechol 2,3-dioxygenase-like lactoylglutathione lyase family enzyme